MVTIIEDINEYFLIIEEVGSGSFGKIFKVQAKKNFKIAMGQSIKQKKQYAMKEIKVEKKEKEKIIEGEYNILRQLKHKNILKAYALFKKEIKIGLHSSVYYMITELLDIELSVYRFNRKKKFDLDEIKRIMMEIFQGIEYIHNSQSLYPSLESIERINAYIIHFDLKVENIMVKLHKYKKTIDKIKIIDFGLAKIISTEITQLTDANIGGTLLYIAPEMYCTGISDLKHCNFFENFYGKSVDLWACGVIFFFLLFGIYPFAKGEVNIKDLYLSIVKYATNPKEYVFAKIRDKGKTPINKDYIINFIDKEVWNLLLGLFEPKGSIRITATNAFNICKKIRGQSLQYVSPTVDVEAYLLEEKMRRKIQRRYENNEFVQFGMDFGKYNMNKLLYEQQEDDPNKCRILCKIGRKIYFFCSHILNKKELFAHLVQNAESLQRGQTLLCNECAAKNL